MKKKYIKIPKDFYKDLDFHIEFDWNLYYKIKILAEWERIKRSLSTTKQTEPNQ